MMDNETRLALGEALSYMFEHRIPWIRTGSQEVGGATEESDWDIVALWPPSLRWPSEVIRLSGDVSRLYGWEQGESGRFDDPTFRSFKKAKVNLIVVHNPEEFRLWKLATRVCKALGPCSKPERIEIFDGVFEQNRRPFESRWPL